MSNLTLLTPGKSSKINMITLINSNEKDEEKVGIIVNDRNNGRVLRSNLVSLSRKSRPWNRVVVSLDAKPWCRDRGIGFGRGDRRYCIVALG